MFALAWALGGQIAAQLVTPMFFALSLLAVWILARDCGADADEAWTGVVLAASLPVLHWAESVPKNDAGVTFFLLCSLVAAVRWRATHPSSNGCKPECSFWPAGSQPRTWLY